MTSIYDIPYIDIKEFLLANNKNFESEQDAYNEAFKLFENKKAKNHTISIIEWIIAHNLLINNIDIPYYSIDDIDNMHQNDINKLAKLLTMNGNDRSNIKNILRYLNKLYDEQQFLLPDIKEYILDKLNKLEMQEIDFTKLKYEDVIYLLLKHRNKKEIRKFIYINLENIIIYNSVFSYLSHFVDNVNTPITINDQNVKIYIGNDEMFDLVNFTFHLIRLNEIVLAKNVFDISNHLPFCLMNVNDKYNYGYMLKLIYSSVIRKGKELKTVIDFLGEDDYLENYFLLKGHRGTISVFLENLVYIEEYSLLIKILQRFIDNNFNNEGDIIEKILPKIEKSIQSKNKNNIIKYIQSLRMFTYWTIKY